VSPTPAYWNGNRSLFWKVVLFSVLYNTERWTSSKIPVITSVIHHCQMPLESTRWNAFQSVMSRCNTYVTLLQIIFVLFQTVLFAEPWKHTMKSNSSMIAWLSLTEKYTRCRLRRVQLHLGVMNLTGHPNAASCTHGTHDHSLIKKDTHATRLSCQTHHTGTIKARSRGKSALYCFLILYSRDVQLHQWQSSS
jgi:hypothetical protein